MYLIAVSVLTELQSVQHKKKLENRYEKEEKCCRHLYHPENKHCVHAYKVVLYPMLKLKNNRSNNSWQCLWDTLWRHFIIAPRMLCFKISIWKKSCPGLLNVLYLVASRKKNGIQIYYIQFVPIDFCAVLVFVGSNSFIVAGFCRWCMSNRINVLAVVGVSFALFDVEKLVQHRSYNLVSWAGKYCEWSLHVIRISPDRMEASRYQCRRDYINLSDILLFVKVKIMHCYYIAPNPLISYDSLDL